MVVRESGAVIDKLLLGGALDLQILFHFVSQVLDETKCEIKTRAAAVAVTDMAAGPGCDPALQNSVPYRSDRGVIQRSDIAPHRRSLAHVSGHTALQQVISDVGEIVFGGLERFARARPHADAAKSAVNGACITRPAGDISAGALEGR